MVHDFFHVHVHPWIDRFQSFHNLLVARVLLGACFTYWWNGQTQLQERLHFLFDTHFPLAPYILLRKDVVVRTFMNDSVLTFLLVSLLMTDDD